MGVWGVGKIFDFCKGPGGLGEGALYFPPIFITYISKYTYFRVIISFVEKQ